MRKLFSWILWFLIGIIVLAIGTNHLIDVLIHSKKDRVVPNIVGKNIADSLDILSSINLYLKKTGEEFNVEIPCGLIISQSPVEGSIIKEGKSVNVVVSVGSEVIYIPDLTNQTVRSAQLILRKNGLDLGEQDEIYSTVIEKGNIVSQNPNPRTHIQKDGLVNIVVSLGLPPEGTLIMPNFLGKDIFEAQNWANQNDIKISNINKVEDLVVAKNTITKQMPENNTIINKDETIEFWTQ
ncbi:MAG: PASTA domain-containing protein [Elusimicrobiota bacterium]